MAWSSAELSATELASFAADKPIIGAQACPRSPTDVRWNSTGSLATADDTDADYPTRRAYDGKAHLPTLRTNAAASSYLIFDFGAAGIEFDAVLLLFHQGGVLTGLTIEVDIDNASNFATATNLASISSWPATAINRWAQWDLHHTGSVPRRYSTVRYARVGILAGSPIIGGFGEVIFLRRRQLTEKPNYPFDETSLHDSTEEAESNGAVGSDLDWYRNRFELDAEWDLEDADVIADVIAWKQQVRSTFVWCYAPTSAPQEWHFMRRTRHELSLPSAPAAVRQFTLTGVEQGPERLFLASGS